jgi:hypothetical protein
MADQVKLVDKALPSPQRYITFEDTELSTGDIIRVVESLGRSADSLTIEAAAGCDLSIRLNSRVNVYPSRQYPEQHPFPWVQNSELLLADPREFDTGVGEILVGNASAQISYSLTDMPISNLEVIFTVGTFTILLS